MALRAIRVLGESGDASLRKKCREVTKMTPRIKDLIDDMFDTMYDAQGVGLAAPQVGVLRRVVVIDIGDGPIVLINPEIIERHGEQREYEGCLSVPGKSAYVIRPERIVFRAYDEEMNQFESEAEGLLARAVCHETDHLEGKIFSELTDKLLSSEDIDAIEAMKEEEESGKA